MNNTDRSILTYNGHYVHLTDPDPATICIRDIAHALSQISRFGGHTRRFYSVAQHSVLVSQLVKREYRLAALLHDAAEAYFGDMVSPLKYLAASRDYRDYESAMQWHINRRFGVDIGLEPDHGRQNSIRYADLVMLATERRDLMATDCTPWPILHDVAPRDEFIVPLMPIEAEALFLKRYKDLSGVL